MIFLIAAENVCFRNFPAVFSSISIEQKCPKTCSLQAAIPKLSLASKKFVDMSSGLSPNWSFSRKFDGQR